MPAIPATQEVETSSRPILAKLVKETLAPHMKEILGSIPTIAKKEIEREKETEEGDQERGRIEINKL
jgi:siroheme synthase (precorrin-2 oxidase/ferrochelatase)